MSVAIMLFSHVLMSCSTGIVTHSAFENSKWDHAAACEPANIADTKIRKMKDPVYRFGVVSYRRIGAAGGPIYEFDEGATLQYEGREYSVRLLRMTAPSEHRVLGMAFLLELQFFAVSPEGDPLALSILVRKGKDRPALRTIVSDSSGKINLSELLPAYGGHYTYRGSLPIPPCQAVRWIILKSGLEVSAEDVDEYLNRWPSIERQTIGVEPVEETE